MSSSIYDNPRQFPYLSRRRARRYVAIGIRDGSRGLRLDSVENDARNDHLCESIAEDIIASLTRFRNLMVIARHSAFLFNLNANPAQEVQRCLGVRYILGGSLRRADKRLRIAVELIDAASESALWSDRFNVELEDLFDLQDEIAGAVAARLSIQIDVAERRQESPHPRDLRGIM